jgi:UPF0271 protein
LFDFNCDVAQSYGVYKNEVELEIAKYASSINVSAGFHAGDTTSIRSALLFASENNVAIGAHIGYPDIQGFGKRQINMSDDELEALVVYQVGAIIAYAKTMDGELVAVSTEGNEFNELWLVDMGLGYEHAPCIVAESKGVVYAGSRRGIVTAVNPKTKAVIWSLPLGVSEINGIDVDQKTGDVYVSLIEGTIWKISKK